MRNKFVRFYTPAVRIGRILEILDYVGVTTAFRYLYQKRGQEQKATIVTACVDHVNIYNSININQDLIITSYPSFVGKSSLEVQIDIWQ